MAQKDFKDIVYFFRYFETSMTNQTVMVNLC